MEKSKSLQLLLYISQLLLERIHHHKTSSSTSAKGSSLRQETQKGCINLNLKQQSKWQRIILFNNYLKCKWIEWLNQKTMTGWMDTKIRPLYMLSNRDPPQNKGHIQTENEGLEKDISWKWRPKESKNSNTDIKWNRHWNKGCEKKQRRTLYNGQRINPRRR